MERESEGSRPTVYHAADLTTFANRRRADRPRRSSGWFLDQVGGRSPAFPRPAPVDLRPWPPPPSTYLNTGNVAGLNRPTRAVPTFGSGLIIVDGGRSACTRNLWPRLLRIHRRYATYDVRCTSRPNYARYRTHLTRHVQTATNWLTLYRLWDFRALVMQAASSGKRNVTAWRPSVCLSRLFLTHTQRDSPEGSTRRGRRTFLCEYYEDG